MHNLKWVGDITYIPTDEGRLYAAIVKDLCDKKIVGYAFSSRIDTNLTVATLKMSVLRQNPSDDLIFHSDRGVQYASKQYRETLASFKITQSMSRKCDPYDNAVAENFFSCLKCELTHHRHTAFRLLATVLKATSSEAHCQANRGINAGDLSKSMKNYDSFRFLKHFCVYFFGNGSVLLSSFTVYN